MRWSALKSTVAFETGSRLAHHKVIAGRHRKGICSAKRIHTLPASEPPRVDKFFYRLDAPSEMKGQTQASQVHMCRFRVLKRILEILGSRQPQKRGDFVITESQNRMTQREKSSDFS
jgi:hypothetical protein